MADPQNVQSSFDDLQNHFRDQTELSDLHTHLLGMGDDKFWVKKILMKEEILPTNEKFKRDSTLRKALCHLVWNPYRQEFIRGDAVAVIFDELRNTNYPDGSWKTLENLIAHYLPKPNSVHVNVSNGSWGDVESMIRDRLSTARPIDQNHLNTVLEDLKDFIEPELPEQTPVFYSMIKENNKFARELRNRGLAFANNFSYDVVLKLTDLASGLGVSNRCNEFIQAAVEEKLAFHIIPASDRPKFIHWIIFNARAQSFEVAYGITVEELRKLINGPNTPIEAREIARANLSNAISMRDAAGTDARPIDINSFQGMFTPEFYPRRFALKDSIYSQRLDVLAHLLSHVLYRYSTCHPPVTYCEFSVGVGDITRPWVFDVLCSRPNIPVRKTAEPTIGLVHN